MRDFFYNKSDVLIAIMIILAAAVVIYMRVGVIMDYPSKMAGGGGNTYLPPIQDVLAEGLDAVGIGSPTGANSNADSSGDAAGVVTGQNPAADSSAEPWTPVSQGNPQPVGAAPADVAPAETVTPPAAAAGVTITVAAGDVGSSIADKLLTAGAITDKAAFLAEVTAQGADTKLKQGTFTIPAGTALSEIVKILVG